MSSFSPSNLQVIADFARDLGVDATTSPDGGFHFEFSRSGLLSLTSSVDGERVVISLAQERPGGDVDRELKFLRQAGFDPLLGCFLHAGRAENGLLVGAVSLEGHEFSIQSLDRVLQQLMAMHERAR